MLSVTHDLNLAFGYQAKRPLPVHHIQKRIIGIQQHTLRHLILPLDSRFVKYSRRQRSTPSSGSVKNEKDQTLPERNRFKKG
jgi:hypothetical protein